MPETEPTADATEASGVRVPPPLYFVAGFLIGVALEAAFPISRPPDAVTVIGAVVGFGGWLALDGAAMVSFLRARTSPIPQKPSSALVTDGVYRFTRNPMYVGMALIHVGLAFALGFVWPLVILPFVLIAIDRFVIATEERYLKRRFGQPYLDYMGRVRRWV